MAEAPVGIPAEINLLYRTVTQLNQTAHDAVAVAQSNLNALAQTQAELPLGTVDVRIGENTKIQWTRDLVPPDQPEEPEVTAPDAPDIPDVLRPNLGGVGALPGWDYEEGDRPAKLPSDSISAVPEFAPLRTVSAAVPAMDVALLADEFSFAEPVYVQRVPEIETGLKQVLGGNLGIPQDYWDALWVEVQGNLAEAAQAKLRTARNRGAASFWGLPTETVLAASRDILQERKENEQRARLEQAKQQAVFAREDFWQAVGQGLAYENAWIAAHQQMAARALSAAEQLHRLRVEVHNANITRFNAVIARAQADGSLQDLAIQAQIRQHGQRLAAISAEIERDRVRIQRHQAEWSAWKTDSDVGLNAFAQHLGWWNAQVDADHRYAALEQGKSKLDVERYSAQLGAIDAISRAAAAVLGARVGAAQYGLAAQRERFQVDTAKNTAELDRARISVAAQQSAAQIDVAQAQWMSGQGVAIVQRLAELTTGLAQAALAASDVSYGRSVDFRESWSY